MQCDALPVCWMWKLVSSGIMNYVILIVTGNISMEFSSFFPVWCFCLVFTSIFFSVDEFLSLYYFSLA